VGLPGAVGVAALSVYFFGSYLAHLSGYMELIAFLAGLTLLAWKFSCCRASGLRGRRVLC
jgi:hypothetical protein